MRTWFWTLLLAVVAVALAVLLRQHGGNVLILAQPWRIQVSLTFAVVLLILAFAALYAGLRLLSWLVAIPGRVRAWRGRRVEARDHELLERAWIQLLEGRYAHAEKDLTRLLAQTRSPARQVLAALSAARAAHGLGEFARRDALFDQAQDKAGADAGLHEAVATVAADLLLEQGRAQDALDRLAPLQDGGARHLHTVRLLLRAHHQLGHHEQTFNLARTLSRRGVVDQDEARRLIEASASARLRAAGDETWRAIWKELKADERTLPEVALAGAAAYDAAGQHDESTRVLEAAIAERFEPRLLAAYARCDASQVPRRLEKAEAWLQKQPRHPDVLSLLGVLCLTGQLWGAAERYLLRSLRQRSDAHVHALLGSLYDRLDRPAEAARHWRLATAAGMALPVLAADGALPPADTAGDPALLDAQELEFLAAQDAALPSGPAPAAPAAPVEAAAAPPREGGAGAADPTADYLLDPPARRAAPAAAVAAQQLDIEDLFDSAPIPGLEPLPEDAAVARPAARPAPPAAVSGPAAAPTPSESPTPSEPSASSAPPAPTEPTRPGPTPPGSAPTGSAQPGPAGAPREDDGR